MTGPIITAREKIREKHAADLARWTDLYAALGRAEQAHVAGDVSETRRWLIEASDVEYELLCSCDITGEALEKLGLDPGD